MRQATRVTVIIVNFRTPDLVSANLEALGTERDALPGLRVVVVDGGSGDDSAQRIGEYIADGGLRSWVSLVPLEVNGGFGWANNQAIRAVLQERSSPSYIYLLNPDASVRPGAIARLVEALDADERAGAAGSRLLGDDNAILGSAFRFPSAGSEFARGADTGWITRLFGIRPLRIDSDSRTQVDWVTGASVMFRPEALRSAGIFDEGFFLYFEEIELMHRMRKCGWHVLHEPASEVVHVGGASTGVGVTGQPPKRLPDYWHRSRLRYLARTRGKLGATWVNISWLAGKTIWACRKLIGKAPGGRHPPGEIGGMLRAGLWPVGHDLRPHGATLDGGESEPAWQNR